MEGVHMKKVYGLTVSVFVLLGTISSSFAASQAAAVDLGVVVATPESAGAESFLNELVRESQEVLDKRLFEAVNSDDQVEAIRLIKEGASVNAQGTAMFGVSKTVLECAIEAGMVDVVTLLLDRGAHSELNGDRGRILLERAVRGCWRGDSVAGIVKELLKHEVDVEACDRKGATTLITAAKNGYSTEVVRVLLDAGAHIDAQDIDGNTALMHACAKADSLNLDIIQVLLAAGADTHVYDHADHCSALMAVVRQKKSDFFPVARMLILAGADSNTEDGFGQTPWAVAQENEDWKDVFLKAMEARASHLSHHLQEPLGQINDLVKMVLDYELNGNNQAATRENGDAAQDGEAEAQEEAAE